MRPSGLGIFFFGRFLIIGSISICHGSVEIFYLFLSQHWQFVFPMNLSVSSRLSNVLPYSCSQYSNSFTFCNNDLSFVSSFSYMHLSCFLLQSSKGLLVLLIFSKNQLLDYLFYCVSLLSFFYALFFIISFLLLVLCLVCSSFSSS